MEGRPDPGPATEERPLAIRAAPPSRTGGDPIAWRGRNAPPSTRAHRLRRPRRAPEGRRPVRQGRDRKSTRLNSSHSQISYAAFCLKKKITLMRPYLVLFLVLWIKLAKDFFKSRCKLALLPYLISCLICLDLEASLPLIKERILVIILLLHFLSLMLGSLLFFFYSLLVPLTPHFTLKKRFPK